MSRRAAILIGIALMAAAAVAAIVRERGDITVGPAKPARRIDVHTHVHPAMVRGAVDILRRNGVDAFVNLSGGGPGRGLEEQLTANSRYPGRVVVFANIDWQGFGAAGWVDREIADLRRAKVLGARGLKISKALGLGVRDTDGSLLTVDDSRLDPLFAAAGRLDLPIAIHSGDPRAFFEPLTPENERWDELSLNPHWSFHGAEFPSWEEVFGAFVRRVERHPETTFIGVHFGNAPEDPERISLLLDRLPNLYVDTAARVGEIGRDDVPGRREALREVFLRHRRRILFGTDTMVLPGSLVLGAPEPRPHTLLDAQRFFEAHWSFFETGLAGMQHPTPIQGRWTVSGLDLPPDVQADLYHRNAERLIEGLRP